MSNYKFDFTTQTLTITKGFAEKASTPTNEEYKLLLQFQKDFPNLKILRKTHKTPKKYTTKSGEVYRCNQYKNLTYANMEHFINALPEGENKEKVIESYNFLRYNANSIQTSPYKTVRDWFIQQFPLYRKNPLFYLTNEIKVINITPFIDLQEKQNA